MTQSNTLNEPWLPADTQGTKCIVHKLALILVAVTIGSGAIVFTEPAPVDALTLGLLVALPAIGLVAIRPALIVILSVLMVLGGAAFLASALSSDLPTATIHTAVSVYLYLAAVMFAAFIVRNPYAHAKLILDAYLVAAMIAAAAGIAGYFNLVPGAAELFTKFGRASGTFKDPNVFGAFLVLAVVYQLHLAISGRGIRSLASFAGLGVLTFAVLLSLSRGAWAATALAVIVYGYLTFVTAQRNLDRAKLVGLALAGTLSAGLIVVTALQFDSVSMMMEERLALTHDYDVGPEGRFGGHDKARDLILENPLGIGAREFSSQHHVEDVHNVYLSMFLNAGWLGGFLYLALVALTLLWGLRHSLRQSPTQPMLIVCLAALAATALLGKLIDTDHWRHFYLLLGLTWGLMLCGRAKGRSARIISDARPLLMQPVIVIPPPHRPRRIVGRASPALSSGLLPRRPARIKAAAR